MANADPRAYGTGQRPTVKPDALGNPNTAALRVLEVRTGMDSGGYREAELIVFECTGKQVPLAWVSASDACTRGSMVVSHVASLLEWDERVLQNRERL